MFADPWMRWPDGPYPYDALAEAGITPDSSMAEVRDVPWRLIEKGLWSPARRAAWDQVRTVEGRLWVDFFLYAGSRDEIVRTLQELAERLTVQPSVPELADLLRREGDVALQEMERDFREIPPDPPPPQRLTDFDEPATLFWDRIKFDDGGIQADE